MIDYLSGTLAELSASHAVVDCHGVGYAVSISLTTYSSLQGKTNVKVYVYENIREDAYRLFGFATKSERELFSRLIGVSGIGSQTASMLLSAFSPVDLARAITNADERMLQSAKGVGPKAAQRIIVELRDKLPESLLGPMNPDLPPSISVRGPHVEEAVEALVMLGFPAAASKRVVREVVAAHPDLGIEEIVKLSLKSI